MEKMDHIVFCHSITDIIGKIIAVPLHSQGLGVKPIPMSCISFLYRYVSWCRHRQSVVSHSCWMVAQFFRARNEKDIFTIHYLSLSPSFPLFTEFVHR